MTGIKAYSVYVPFYRIKRSEIAAAYGKSAKKGERALAYYDEDSLTMAVGAAMDTVAEAGAEKIGAIYFATTTPPYREKQCATQIAACVDAGPEIRTADYTGSLKAGADAMLAANDFAAGGRDALVAVGDCRLGAADGSYEMELGDGAAAFLFGSENVIAELKSSCCISMDYHDMWRADDDRFVRFWDVRYANSMHYEPMVKQAVRGLLAKTGLQPADITSFVSYAHEDRYRTALAAKLGFTPEQIPAGLYGELGNTGCACAPQLLASVLDTAKPGDKILFVGYGEGCTAMLLEVTDAIRTCRPRVSVRERIDRKDNSVPYGKYLKWKDLVAVEPQRRPEQERSSLPDYFRGYKKNNAMYGCRCRACGTPQFPPQRVCANCHAVDEMEPYRFIGKKASIRTFTLDGLALSKDPPNNLVVVDFEGGGKVMTYMVDVKREDMRVGMPVELSFRRLFKANGVHTYFWKVVPSVKKEES